jgi:hypothetical protein
VTAETAISLAMRLGFDISHASPAGSLIRTNRSSYG